MEAPNLPFSGLRGNIGRRYLAAGLAAALALAVRGLLAQFGLNSHPYTTLFIATAFSVWYAGFLPSFLTATAGWAVAKFFFIAPFYSLRIATGEERNRAIAYCAISCAIILFGDLSRRTITKQRRNQVRLLTIQNELEDRIRQRTAALQVTNENLRDLSARLLKVRDEEQRRIARHLHDSTAQTLAALTLNLQRLEKDAKKLSASVAKMAADSAVLAKEVSDSVRTVSYLLHPPLLDEAGLEGALSWYADGFEKRSGIKVHLAIPPDLERQPIDLETGVFRVVQECLTNIHRHSASPTADIRLCQFAGGMALEIKDTGRGIPVEMLSKISSIGLPGVGLRGMRERITALGGGFEISSEGPGKGTTVKVAIPLRTNVPQIASAMRA
ncbi:MAG TPA: sensor histidine kinase [Candidatus Acidoferrales bacterium]|nr:sensor histidine kinase [Candidatus Acidoferrales bacterium]